jgi:hypothetical protein
MNITPKDMTPTTELIEAAKAVIARWDSTDWKAPPTAEGMNRLRAALSAKLPEVEDIEEWMQHNHRYERDGSSTKYTKVFDYGRVEYYVHQLTAAHAAELNNLHAQIGDLLAISAKQEETK